MRDKVYNMRGQYNGSRGYVIAISEGVFVKDSGVVKCKEKCPDKNKSKRARGKHVGEVEGR